MTEVGPMPDADGGAARLIERARTRLALSRLLHLGLLLTVGFGFALGSLLAADWIALLALLAAFVWVFLVVRSARMVRRVRGAWAAVRLGQFAPAEAGAREALATWSLLRPVTLGAMQVLAHAAHGRRRHDEAAEYAAFVLSRPERLLVGDRTDIQLLLVESLLEMNQLALAQASAAPLYAQKLQLENALRLLGLQLRMEARAGAFTSMAQRIGSKVDMAELMAPPESALSQALLALAAQRAGLESWADWLLSRVSLLSDPPALARREPVLLGLGAAFAREAPVVRGEMADSGGPD